MKEITKFAVSNGYSLGALTVGETIEIAKDLGRSVSDVVIAEAMFEKELEYDEVLNAVEAAFNHNLQAIDVGMSHGKSFLMGQTAKELAENNFANKIIDDEFINKALVYTLAAQVGNHSVGLTPCAGTGDSCPYTGLFKAIKEFYGREKAVKSAAVMLKVGTIFREGKVTTGCNMEGFGAGSAATAAAFVELLGGTPEAMDKAIVLSLSPTIANPCTTRVMVAGLCAAHISGAILNGNLAAKLTMHTSLPINVPVDVMVAMAAAVHPVSAKHVVPVVNQYMRAFFKTNNEVESYIANEIKKSEQEAIHNTIKAANASVKKLAKASNSIISPFGQAVVGGSSQAVGSPTNTGRIAHYLTKGNIKKVKIELYPELFARRGINVPGILMGAVYGSHTGDGDMYHDVMGKVLSQEIEVEIIAVDEAQVQRVTIETDDVSSMVDALNRGGGRLVLRNASPSLEQARKVALELGIVVVEDERGEA